jgi:hypothetical protein
MMQGALRCVKCGAVWQSVPAAQVAAARGGCLRCGGELVAATDPAPPGADGEEPDDS